MKIVGKATPPPPPVDYTKCIIICRPPPPHSPQNRLRSAMGAAAIFTQYFYTEFFVKSNYMDTDNVNENFPSELYTSVLRI